MYHGDARAVATTTFATVPRQRGYHKDNQQNKT